MVSEPTACWRTLSRKKQTLAAWRKSWWIEGEPEGKLQAGLPLVFVLNPFMELGPACADPITGGVRGRKAAGNDPDYEIDHLRLDHAARLRFLNVTTSTGRVGFFAKPMSGLFVLPR